MPAWSEQAQSVREMEHQSMSEPILQVQDIEVRYEKLVVLHGISLSVSRGEMVCLVGANGAGKSTILRSIMGAQRVAAGSVQFDGRPVHHLRTEAIVRLGMVYVPEEKMLFKPLSVEENLLLGAYSLGDGRRIEENLDFVYRLYPKLLERRRQPASTLSGGEQQMVAIARALMSRPKLLLLDEPSLGLAPPLVTEALHRIQAISRDTGAAVLIVEQKVREVLEIARRVYVLRGGQVTFSGPTESLADETKLREVYL